MFMGIFNICMSIMAITFTIVICAIPIINWVDIWVMLYNNYMDTQ